MQKLLDTWANETPFALQRFADNDKSDAAKSFVLLEDNLKPLATSLSCSYVYKNSHLADSYLFIHLVEINN